ncbi:MAG: hypothetical protein ICV62_12095 [Cyanobacteria bacterium Co-bin13]|nr:hypothetical protein [Cyanobacteria bacterium Co-bin13]
MPLELTPSSMTVKPCGSLYTLSNLRRRIGQGLELGKQTLQQRLFTKTSEIDAMVQDRPFEGVAAYPLTDEAGTEIWEVYDRRTQTKKVFYTENEARLWCEKHYLR